MKFDKPFIILTLGRIAQAALALVAIRFLTGLLDKENVGMTYLVYSLSTYFSLILINPLGMYLNRRLHHWFQEKKMTAAFRVLNWYFLGVGILSVPVVLIGYFLLNIGTGFTAWQICLLVFLNIYASTWFQTLCPTLNMLEFRNAFVTINLVAQVVGLVFSIVGVLLIEKSAFVWLMGILAGQSLGAVLAWLYFRRHVEGGPSAQADRGLFFNKSVLYFCLPIAITTAFMWGQNHSYRLIVEAKMGAQALGILGVGLGVAASIAGLVESVVSQYFFPQYYATISVEGPTARARAWQVLALHSLAVYVPATLFVIFGAQFILRVLVSASFEESLSLVAWGAGIEFFRMAINVLYAVSQSEMKTRSTILPYAVGAIAVVAGLWLCLHFAEPMKTVYVPMVLVGAGALASLSMYWNMKKILEVQLDFKFIALSVCYSLPLLGMYFVRPYVQSLIGSILVCGIFGIYLLFAIWRLNRTIEMGQQTLRSEALK